MTALTTWQTVNVWLPLAIDNRSHDVPVFDQGQELSCSAQAIVDICEIAEKLQGRSVNLSRQFQYFNERLIESTTTQNVGVYADDVCSAASYYGICLESSWPYTPDDLTLTPPATAYVEAAQHKVTSYAMLPLAQVKQALTLGYPVLLNTTIRCAFGAVFGNPQQQATVFANYQNSPVDGNHFMVIEGFTKDYYIVRNSWGAGWGDQGYCYLPYSAFDSNVLNCWVVLGYNGTPLVGSPAQPQTHVFLGGGEVVNIDSPCVVYGGNPKGAVILLKDAKNVVLDSNVATISIPDRSIADLGLLQQGGQLVIDYNGTVLVAINTSNNVAQTLILGGTTHTLLRMNATMTIDGTEIK